MLKLFFSLGLGASAWCAGGYAGRCAGAARNFWSAKILAKLFCGAGAPRCGKAVFQGLWPQVAAAVAEFPKKENSSVTTGKGKEIEDTMGSKRMIIMIN